MPITVCWEGLSILGGGRNWTDLGCGLWRGMELDAMPKVSYVGRYSGRQQRWRSLDVLFCSNVDSWGHDLGIVLGAGSERGRKVAAGLVWSFDGQ
jgi:hypothetical protein